MHRLLFLFAGQGSAAVFIMARNLCLARGIGLESYGSATAVLMVLAIVELVTNLGIQQQIVSRPDGASRHVQAALHGAQIVRGTVGGIAILMCSATVAWFLNAPDLTWMLAIAALSPVLLGFVHLDAYRAQRHRRHSPQILMLTVPAVTSFLALWPLLHWLDGSSIVLALVAIQTGSHLVISHAIAKRNYTFQLSQKQALSCLKFGLPLAGNGVLLCAVLHFEKLMAGHFFGMSALALIALGSALTMTPALTAARGFQAYHLPILRRVSGKADMNTIVLERGCNAGAALAIMLAALAPFVLEFLGASFEKVLPYLPWLIVLAALRLPKSALATIALANGQTHFPMFANLPRLLLVPVIWWSATNGASLQQILLIALVGETLGVMTGLFASRKLIRVPSMHLLILSLACALVLNAQVPMAATLFALFLIQNMLDRYAQHRRVTA